MLLVGIDLVENKRIQKSISNPRFLRRILGTSEYSQLEMRGFPVQSVAASFCAKEAFSKALGTGIRGFLLSEVELLRKSSGEPYLCLSGGAQRIAESRGIIFHVSVTHTKEYASAVVIGEEKNNEGIKL
ncbi:MAG: holo-ACP synthase [Clostridiales bacterium]|jgi:holo-[acyl-carrier protein] synthase|nr:holo-ACP synthase [Clostridiales bacterium]